MGYSDMISKTIYVSIIKTLSRQIRLFLREYEWVDSGSFIGNDGSNMLYIVFKFINL